MSVPKVSVVIPAYNSSETIGRALDSVFRQSFADFEVVIVDDGSTDDLAGALAPYGDRIDLVRQANAGASAARNCGVRRSRGELLAFLDADDFWHERKLELQVAAFARHPDIVLCCTHQRHWYAGQPNPYVPLADDVFPEIEYSRDFNAMFLAPYLGTPGVMIPRTLFFELDGFREDLASAEDIDLWLRAAFRGPIARIKHPLFYVVPRPNSLTAKRADGTFQDNLQVIEEFCRAHPQFATSQRRTVNQARARVYEDWGSVTLVRGESAGAMDLLGRSLSNKFKPRVAYLYAKAMLRRTLNS